VRRLEDMQATGYAFRMAPGPGGVGWVPSSYQNGDALAVHMYHWPSR